VDPIGAGGAYVIDFLRATVEKHATQEAVETADVVAGFKCSTWGATAVIGVRDVEDALASGPDVRR